MPDLSGAPLILHASAVAVDGRATLITGKPGSGKSSLALALIDRGAKLIGDDGVSLVREGNRLMATPPPNIAGKLEIRGVGIVDLVAVSAPLALILDLDGEAPRLPPEALEMRDFLGCTIPCLSFDTSAPSPALRAEWALRLHGLAD